MSAVVRRALLLRHYAAGLYRAEVLVDRMLAKAWARAMARALRMLGGSD